MCVCIIITKIVYEPFISAFFTVALTIDRVFNYIVRCLRIIVIQNSFQLQTTTNITIVSAEPFVFPVT